MGTEIVKVSPNLNVEVNYPSGTLPSVVEAGTVAVMSIATSLLKNLIYSTGAVIEAYDNTRTRISLIQERNRKFREYIIPTIALYDAVQMGRNFVYSSNWDEDLKRKALEDINGIFEQYRVS